MFVVPVATPVTMPVDPIIATPVVVLVHVPPAGVGVSAIVALTHSAVGPVIVGIGFIVTIAVLMQPVRLTL
jgi:hypothetical protein